MSGSSITRPGAPANVRIQYHTMTGTHFSTTHVVNARARLTVDTLKARFDALPSKRRVLVLATCHTTSAYQTIERILNAFPAEQQSQIVATGTSESPLLAVVRDESRPAAPFATRLLPNP